MVRRVRARAEPLPHRAVRDLLASGTARRARRRGDPLDPRRLGRRENAGTRRREGAPGRLRTGIVPSCALRVLLRDPRCPGVFVVLKEACGLFGVFGAPNAVELTYLGLYAQQHRGQESAGIASVQGDRLVHHKDMGLVSDVFSREVLSSLKSHAAIGHVRYSTTGASSALNAQPLVVDTAHFMLAVGHNGNLVNSAALRRELERQQRFFPIFHTTTDTEIVLYLVAREPDLLRGIRHAVGQIRGAYSLVFLTPDRVVAVRDPNGFRPLVLGKRGGAWAVASETCAFDLSGIEYVREVEPGEIVTIDRNGPRGERFLPKKRCAPKRCVFEHVYFARPDSRVFGDTVHVVRRRLGRALAREHPVTADLVAPIPDSGMSAALGFAEESGIPFELAFMRNHYVGRTFIQPSQDQRSANVEIKLAVVREVVAGKRVVVVDDSVIRGTTSRSRIRLLREAGAKEVHLRVSCPPTRHPCYYGIDFPDPKDLIAAKKTVEAIRTHIGVDSLGYLSLEGMLSCVTGPPSSYCTACWTGTYSVEPVDAVRKDIHEREQRTEKKEERGGGSLPRLARRSPEGEGGTPSSFSR
ncbi:MAG: amidophosphoribosyltransferase [Planctomycetes bacterium]|nr:amidophosphoribosyltransferase [Planctomycetota bacterium]